MLRKHTVLRTHTYIRICIHTVDSSGDISFMERKMIMADRNEDGSLDMDEWVWADYPAEYGPFKVCMYVCVCVCISDCACVLSCMRVCFDVQISWYNSSRVADSSTCVCVHTCI